MSTPLLCIWQTEEVIATIAGYLDLKSIARMCSVSTPIFTYLIKGFNEKAHPYAVAYMANQIMDQRKRTLSGFEMETRNQTLARFFNLDTRGHGHETFIEINVAENRRWFSIKTSYCHREGAFSTALSHVEANIYPSNEKPTRNGTVTVTKHDTGFSSSFEYANGIDPKVAIETWCPLLLAASSSADAVQE
jgi:hypothetical protein